MSIPTTLLLTLLTAIPLFAESYRPSHSHPIWPGQAPGETTQHTGTQQPFRDGEHPPVLRIEQITQPLLQVFRPESTPNGTGALILPGGGYGKVVTNKEGSEAALWLNQHGITAFVLSYRTISPDEPRHWYRPLQDSQRAMRLIRANAQKWGLKKNQIGLVGFSAGGQVASIHLSDTFPHTYDLQDQIDTEDHYPDFALLIYPWNTLDAATGQLMDAIRLPQKSPPTFLLHTDDDGSTSLGTVAIYSSLKRMGIPSELHIYQNGGHGYGMRPVQGSQVGTWMRRASEWLVIRKLGRPLR